MSSRDPNASAPPSPCRPQIITPDGDGERENELLTQLEDLAQKMDVLTHWVDEMYEYVKAVPQSELRPDLTKFEKWEDEPEVILTPSRGRSCLITTAVQIGIHQWRFG